MAETQVTVTIENLAPEGGTFLTPFWVGFHDGGFDSYDRGRPISAGLESLVEDGDTRAFSTEFTASGNGSIDSTIAGTEGIDGPIDPGETVTATFTLDSEVDTDRFFSYASMVIPSNDAFIANGDATAHPLFDESGFIGADFVVAGEEVLDGGTEVNDELAENTAFFSQAEPNTGEDEDGVVVVHPGFEANGRILSEDGTTEGAPAAFNNADFTSNDYQVARITVEETPPEPELIEVTVTIENLAPEGGTFLTPFWVGFHDGDFDTYDRGRPISPGLERLVEDGDTTPFSEEFAASGDGAVDGTIAGTEGIEGPIDPGETVTATFTIDANADNTQFFNYASMVIPSNDAFIANGNPTAHSLFDEEGNFIGTDFIVLGEEVLDGGTEFNTESAEDTAFFSQSEPNTGSTQNGVVITHPGFIEDGRILTEDGTTEGAPAAFNNADFTSDDYQVARITVSTGERSAEPPLPVTDPVNLTATLDGEQEVDGGDTEASGTSTLTLNDTGDSLEYSLTVTGLDFGANGLIEGGEQTADTSDDVTRLHIHNAPTGENGGVVFSLFDTVAPELGNVLDIPGNQDEDLTVTPNDDGSVTLTGVWEETDPTNLFALSEFVPEIRDGEVDEDLDFYWNVRTEEFPDGAIRGQLVVTEEEETPPEPELIEVTVTIENLAPEGGTFLTPFWVGFHDGDFDTYDRGRPISPGLERLVEDGDTTPFSEEFAASGDGAVDGTIAGAEGIEGPIDPGETVTATFTIDANADNTQFFNYASMVIPSNDAFIANGNPTAHSLFDESGNFIGTDFIVLGEEVLDGGTEINNEAPEDTAFFSQTEDDTGSPQDGVVTTHPGFEADGRILSEDGTTEGAPAAFNNADFTADDYQVARITVSVVEDPVSIVSTLDGEQEVDGGDTEASGISELTLNETGNGLEYSLTVTGLDFGANGLIEGGEQTADTSDDVTRLHIHNAPRGENGDVVFSLFDTVAPELGNLSDIPGNQDEDLTVTANDDGSVTLTGVWEGTDPSNTDLSEFVSEIRNAETGSDLDLYWNVHTEEFPGGAIRGQLAIAGEPPEPETLDLFRFRNTNFETGTYVFVGEEEKNAILADEELSSSFSLDGVQEDGTEVPAFTASISEGDNLIPFFRLSSLAVPGTFLFVSTGELDAIFAEDSDQRDQWERQGFDEEGNDIAEFYLYGGTADLGTDFNRFQNNQNNTFLYAGPEESSAIANDPNLTNLFTNQGIAFESLS